MSELSEQLAEAMRAPSGRRLVIVLADADPIEFPVVGDEEAEMEFFYELHRSQCNQDMPVELAQALTELVGVNIYLRPKHVISAFCFDVSPEA